jgi:RNA polymerase sigma-70 factor (ECF subfamily)
VRTPRKPARSAQPDTAETQPEVPQEQSSAGWPVDKEVQAFQLFYQENVGPIYRFIYGKVGNREEAEDLTAQTFMKAVHSLDRARDEHSRQKWLFRVARTTVADYWRTRYRISTSSLDELLDAGWEGPADDGPAEVIGARSVEDVKRILDRLPTNYSEVLHYRFLLNLSIKETAVKMGTTEANVKVLQFRALKRAADLDP